ncbi:unnamed protein product, partial [Allacma fusca]
MSCRSVTVMKDTFVPDIETESCTTNDSLEPESDQQHKEPKPRRSFLGKLLRRRIPIIKWLPSYKKNYLINDAIAGITVGLTVVPQSMGFAALAGLTP